MGLYDGMLPKITINGKLGYYPVSSKEEWDELPAVYKAMEWFPIEYKGKKRAVKRVIFDVTYLEPYKISAHVSVHPQEVQKILFCLYKNTSCHLYSISGVELDGEETIGAKWLQDSRTGAFAVVCGGTKLGVQGGFRGHIPECIEKLPDGTFKYKTRTGRDKHINHFEYSNPFKDEKVISKDEKKELIEKMEALYDEHPYKVVGEPDTYSEYNMAWSDCADRARQIVSEALGIEASKSRNDIEALRADVEKQFGENKNGWGNPTAFVELANGNVAELVYDKVERGDYAFFIHDNDGKPSTPWISCDSLDELLNEFVKNFDVKKVKSLDELIKEGQVKCEAGKKTKEKDRPAERV